MAEKTILLVEDNPDDVELTRRALKKSKIVNPLVVAKDGQEALDLLFAPKPLVPGLILLDLKMPRVGGLEVLKRLRADPATRLLPVVMLTSSKEDRDIIESYNVGCNSYVRKPVDFEQFVAAVQQLGIYWLLLNESAVDLHPAQA